MAKNRELKKLLKQPLDQSKKSVKAYRVSDIEALGVSFDHASRRNSALQFKKFCKKMGLESWAVEILEYKFIDEYSFDEIAKELSYTSRSTVRYLYRKIIKELQARYAKTKRS